MHTDPSDFALGGGGGGQSTCLPSLALLGARLTSIQGSGGHCKHPFPAPGVRVRPRSVLSCPVPFLPTVAAGDPSVCSGPVNWHSGWLIDSNAGEDLCTPAAASQTAVNCRHERDNNYAIMGGFCVSPSPCTVSANTRVCFLTLSYPAEGMPQPCSLCPCSLHPCHPVPSPPPAVLSLGDRERCSCLPKCRLLIPMPS